MSLSGKLSNISNLSGALSKIGGLSGNISSSATMSGSLSNEILRGYSAYDLAVQSGFSGTLQEWLDGLKGEKIELRENDYSIQWKYVSDTDWITLIALDEINDYDTLSNKPTINGAIVEGDMKLNYVSQDDTLSNMDIEELLK